MKPKTPQESLAQMSEIVLPNDTNVLGNLMGGRLLYWIDIAAAIAAQRHSNRVVVTAAVDFVEFRSPIKLGEIVQLEARVTRAFTTSMEVRIEVHAEDAITRKRRHCNTAYYTFVAVDQVGKPIPVNPVEPVTEQDREFYEAATQRRELRLASAGKKHRED